MVVAEMLSSYSLPAAVVEFVVCVAVPPDWTVNVVIGIAPTMRCSKMPPDWMVLDVRLRPVVVIGTKIPEDSMTTEESVAENVPL